MNRLLSCTDSKIIHNTHFYGKFKLGPFQPGQSLTVANTLRRSLLSELSGTSITLVKIEGTSHEYETILGVQECTLDLLLNIKKLVLKTDFDFYTPQVGFLSKKGPGIVRARDLNLPFFVSIIDPDQYIATLTSKGKLNIKFLINCGKNPLVHSPNSNPFQHWVNLLNQTKPSSPLFQTKPEKETIEDKNEKKINEMADAILAENKLDSKKKTKSSKKEDKKPTDVTDDVETKNQKIEKKPSILTQEQSKQSEQSENSKQLEQQEQNKIENNKHLKTIFYDWKMNANKKKKAVVLDLLKKKNIEIKQNGTKTTLETNLEKTTSKKNVISTPLFLTKKQNMRFSEKSESKIKGKFGYFPIDAVFSPVSKVNYSIELKDHFSNQEIIFLEIWTNGAINPRSAIHKTVQGLIQLFLPLQQIKKQIKPTFFSNKIGRSFVLHRGKTKKALPSSSVQTVASTLNDIKNKKSNSLDLYPLNPKVSVKNKTKGKTW